MKKAADLYAVNTRGYLGESETLSRLQPHMKILRLAAQALHGGRYQRRTKGRKSRRDYQVAETSPSGFPTEKDRPTRLPRAHNVGRLDKATVYVSGSGLVGVSLDNKEYPAI